MTQEEIKERLAKLKQYILDENISTGEILELQSLAKHIDPSDTLLLEWAGVPEFPKTFSVSVSTTDFFVEVEAQDEDEAKEKVQQLLEQGSCTNEADTVYYVIGNDIEEIE